MRRTKSPPWWRAKAQEIQRRARRAQVQEAGRRRRDAGAHRAGTAALTCRALAQAALQVGLDVGDVVEAHRDPDHALRDAGRLALRLGEAAVRGARRMGDRGLGVAEVGGDRADRCASITWKALARARCRPPAGAATTKDTTAPPQPDCCAIASACCGCEPGPGSRRAPPPAALRASAPAPAPRALCACIRIDSVSSPFSTTQALNGDSAMPALRITGTNFSLIELSLPQIAPAMTRPWPSRYLVPEWMTRSAPNSIGRCSAGEQKQLSTASRRRRRARSSASAAMSHTSVSGLVGDSANSSLRVRLAPRRAMRRRRSARRSWSRRRTWRTPGRTARSSSRTRSASRSRDRRP